MADERILIVENEREVAELIQQCLQQQGYSVVGIAENGEQGLQQAVELRPDLALMDIHLGGGLDGVQIAERLQADLSIPVIFLTGLPDEASVKRSRHAEAFAYLLKPFRPEELKASIDLALDKHRLARKLQREREQSEQALRESEERHRRLFELFPDAVLVQCAGRIVLINGAGAKLFGAEGPQALVGKSVFDFVHPDYHQAVRERMAALREGGSVALMEQKVVRLDGTVVDVEVTAGALVYRDQPAVQVILRDIRKRKRLEFQKAQITQLGHHLNSAATPREAARIIAETADNLLGWHAFSLDLYSPEQDRIFAMLTMDEVAGQRRPVPPVKDCCEPSAFDRRIMQEGGRLIVGEQASKDLGLTRFGDSSRPSASMMFAPIRDAHRVSGILSIHSYKEGAYSRDDLVLLQFLADHCGGALERLRAQEALRESEERFHAFMDHSPVLAFIKNGSGQYIYGNRAWAGQWKKMPAELLGKTDLDLWPETVARQFQDSDLAVLAAGKPLELIQSGAGRDGRPRDWMLLKFLIHDEGGVKLLGGLALDITERKQAEEELNRSRAQLRSLAAHLESVREEERIRMAREIHDELGQLLTGFKMDLAWLDKRVNGSFNESLRTRLLEKLNSMSAMVDDMVDSVRRISAELRPGALDDLGLVPAMEWQIREFQKRAGMHCHLKSQLRTSPLPPDLCTGVFRIFQETLTNVARHAGATRVAVFLEERAGQLILRVQDNGRGITPHELANSKSLGLIGMRERTIALGGEFKIDGISGSGTTVTVRIPIIPAPGM